MRLDRNRHGGGVAFLFHRSLLFNSFPPKDVYRRPNLIYMQTPKDVYTRPREHTCNTVSPFAIACALAVL